MKLALAAAVYVLAIAGLASGQKFDNSELARRLADSAARGEAVRWVVELGRDKVPTLLEWTRRAPVSVNKYQLFLGMADVFAELKTREAVPFLIKNIGLDRFTPFEGPVWLKAPQVIEERRPAAAALIQIGPDAAPAIMTAFWITADSEDRALMVFVIGRIALAAKDTEDLRVFLLNVIDDADLQRRLAVGALEAEGAPGRR